MFDQPRRDEPSTLSQVPIRANLVLNIILCFLLVVTLRLWHLSCVQHDKKLEEAFLSRKKSWVEPAARGTIRDRFNILLAANKIEYRVSIVYSQFREIPSVIVEKDEKGNKKRRFLRREYIKKFSKTLGAILGIDSARLEDIIYSHAAQNNNIPLLIKSGLTEEEYYRLKLFEKDWQGIQVQAHPKRYYPRARAAADVVGYLGPISKEKYTKIINETRTLSDYVKRAEQGQEVLPPEGYTSFTEAKQRLLQLQEQAYSINDSVGLLGIEASFEEALRGVSGRRIFYSDAKGNALRQLPGSAPPIAGKRVLLSLSIELQEFAEKLLAQAEADREKDARAKKAKEPAMRGGALVAMDPKTGQLVALASFPRFDPNDFVRSKTGLFSEGSSAAVLRWLENENYYAKVWDGMIPLTFERYQEKSKQFVDVTEMLDWDRFLELLLPEGSPLIQQLHSSLLIKEVIGMQQCTCEPIVLDLTRLILCQNDFSPELIDKLGELSIAEYRAHTCAFTMLCQEIKPLVRKRWIRAYFDPWRAANEKEFLKQKRLEEKRAKVAAKPYLEYIDKEEARQFDEFWQSAQKDLILAYLRQEKIPAHYVALQEVVQELDASLAEQFLMSLKGFWSLDQPLVGKYPHLVRGKKEPTLQDLVMGMSRGLGEGTTRSYAFRHGAIQGSLFKLVTAYAGLKQRYEELKGYLSKKECSLFEIVDHTYKQNGKNYVGSFLNGGSIPQIYKGGRIPKSLYPDLGKMDLTRALELSSNPYFSLLAGDYLKDPMQLYNAAYDFGMGHKTNIALPGEASGFLPADIATNRTGLYSMAIGQHTLLTSPLQSAVMLSAIANGGTVLTPRIANLLVGKGQPDTENLREPGKAFAYQEPLSLVGLDFPLFSKAENLSLKNQVAVPPLAESHELFMPKEIQKTLIEGLKKVLMHIHEDKTGALRRLSTTRPDQYRAFMEMKDELVGKTSTAESQEKIGLDLGQPSIIYNHTWFGGISYKDNEPELVVVVYLRYGGYGREAAPIAAQIVKKWREINQKVHTEL